MSKHAVDTITDEWWKDSTRRAYKWAYRELMDHGMKKQDAIDLLTAIYAATAEEFGE